MGVVPMPLTICSARVSAKCPGLLITELSSKYLSILMPVNQATRSSRLSLEESVFESGGDRSQVQIMSQ